MPGVVLCMHALPEEYNRLSDIANRLKSIGISGKIILYIHELDKEPGDLDDIFIVLRYTHYIGRLTALYAALIDFPDKNIILLTYELLRHDSYLKHMLCHMDLYNCVTAIKGYELKDYRINTMNAVNEMFVFGSIPDLNYGCIIPPNIINHTMFNIDFCKNEFKNCEELYFAYILMKHSLSVFYIPGLWRELVNESSGQQLNAEDNTDYLERGIIKLYYLISSEKLSRNYNNVLSPSPVNIIPETKNHDYPLYYISLTSFGKRNKNIKQVIQVLKLQKEYIYGINLWIVDDEYTTEELEELRSYCTGFIDIKIITNPLIKYKSYNKFVHQLTDSWYCKFHTLTIDDDILYPTDFIRTTLETAKLCNYRIPCSGSGFDIDAYIDYKSKRFKHAGSLSFNNVIEGFAGIWYPVNIFSDINNEVLRNPDIEHFGYADDIFISYLIRKSRIPTYYKRDFQDALHLRALPYIDALHVTNSGENGNNMNALKYIREIPTVPIIVINIDRADKYLSFNDLYNTINSIAKQCYVVVRLDDSMQYLKNKIEYRLPVNVCICTNITTQTNAYMNYSV